jgi:dihydroorotate dehydrogenase electron transfer subunit
LLRAEVSGVERCGADGVLLRLRPELELPEVRAGRFFMLRRADGSAPLLPRPFSIYRQLGGELEFLIKVIGCGTQSLAEAGPGTEIALLGPLGNGLPELDGAGASWALLAGGVGVAPFFMGIEQALHGWDGQPSVDPKGIHLLFGAASQGLLYDLERFQELGIAVHVATDDGSAGFHGNVLALLERLVADGVLPERVRIVACGPDPMLEAVERHVRERDLECWFSLETRMACGVGICNGCSVRTRASGPLGDWPYAKCCTEGPVFDARAIELAPDQPPERSSAS